MSKRWTVSTIFTLQFQFNDFWLGSDSVAPKMWRVKSFQNKDNYHAVLFHSVYCVNTFRFSVLPPPLEDNIVLGFFIEFIGSFFFSFVFDETRKQLFRLIWIWKQPDSMEILPHQFFPWTPVLLCSVLFCFVLFSGSLFLCGPVLPWYFSIMISNLICCCGTEVSQFVFLSLWMDGM